MPPFSMFGNYYFQPVAMPGYSVTSWIAWPTARNQERNEFLDVSQNYIHVQYCQVDSIEKKTEVIFDRFVLFGEQKKFWTIRQVVFSICHLHLISDTIFHDVVGPGLKLVYLIDSVSLANGEFSIRHIISLVRVIPCKFVDSADSFYSANKKKVIYDPTSRVSICSIRRI